MRFFLVPVAIGLFACPAWAEHKHALVERFAHDYIYSDIDSTATHQAMMERDGAEVFDTIVDEETGFAAMLVKKDGKTFVILRGTDQLVDMEDYVHDAATQVGRAQYAKFRDKLAAWVSEHKPVTVAGHSLGGALAQRLTADHPESVKEMVLFQSPGVERDVTEKMKQHEGRPPKCTLYVAEHGIISDAGDEHVGKPDVVVASIEQLGDGKIDALLAHSRMLCQDPDSKSPLNGKGYHPHGKIGLGEGNYWDYFRRRLHGESLVGMRTTVLTVTVVDPEGEGIEGVAVLATCRDGIDVEYTSGGECRLVLPFVKKHGFVGLHVLEQPGWKNESTAFQVTKTRIKKVITLHPKVDVAIQSTETETLLPGDPIGLEAVVMGGDEPYTYVWKINNRPQKANRANGGRGKAEISGTPVVPPGDLVITLDVTDGAGRKGSAMLVLYVPGCELRVRVVAAVGAGKPAPVAGADLETRTGGVVLEARTRKNGRRVFAVPEGAEAEIVASKEGYEDAKTKVALAREGPTSCVLTLAPSGILEVKVTSEDGSKLAGVAVTVTYGAKEKAEGETGQFGHFSLRLPPEGPVTVGLEHPKHEALSTEASFDEGRALVEAVMLRAEVEVPEGRHYVETKEYKNGQPYSITEMLEYDSRSSDGSKRTAKHGKRETYSEDGALDGVEHYVMGKRHGEQLEYDTTNADKTWLELRYQWRYGKKHGKQVTYYPSGQVREEYTCIHGDVDGVRNTYFIDGKLMGTGRFVKGEEEGVHKRWSWRGRVNYHLASTTSWRHGRRHGLHVEYNDEGKVLKETQFNDGVEVK